MFSSLRKLAPKVLLVLASLTLLSACSANRLAYNNLDWLIGWKTGEYLSLTGAQKDWLASRTSQHLAWHCSSELPRYEPLLGDLQSSLYDKALDAQMLLSGQPRVEAAVDRLLTEIAPTISQLLGQLDDEQVLELRDNLADKHVELEEKYLSPDMTTQHRERIERAEERLEDWLGPLDEEQRARLALWAAALQGHNQVWLENRKVWQEAFLRALESRGDPDFEERVRSLLIERKRYWTPQFQRVAEFNREQGTHLIVDLMQMANDRQKARLAKRFEDLRGDIQALQCADA